MISVKKLIKLLLKGYTIETKDKDILYFDKESKSSPFRLMLNESKKEVDFNWSDINRLKLKTLLKNGDLSQNGLSKKLKKLVKKNVKKIIDGKYTHSVKIFVGDSDFLTLDAYINKKDPTMIKVQHIKVMGIDDLSLSLLEDIINGKVKHTFIDKKDNVEVVKINEKSVMKNIKKYQSLHKKGYFPSNLVVTKL